MKQSIISKSIRLLVLVAVGIAYAACQIKQNPETVGEVLCNIKLNTFQGVFRLIFVVGYVSGFGLLVAAIFKLKQVKDNPTQIPVSTPIVLFLCAALSIFMPSLIAPAGESIFGGSAANSDVSSVEEVIADGSRIGTPSITNLMDGN
jgi:intracellular multiplication protein IcmD